MIKPTKIEHSVIYGLSDPITGCIRYVGKTDYVNARLAEHILNARKRTKTPKDIWLHGLHNNGLRPLITILEKCPRTEWESRERHWITQFPDLLNIQDGGWHGARSHLPQNPNNKVSGPKRGKCRTTERTTGKPDARELRRVRESTGFSVGVMAQCLDILEGTYYGYEYGRRAVPDEVMQAARDQLKRTRQYWAGMSKRMEEAGI